MQNNPNIPESIDPKNLKNITGTVRRKNKHTGIESDRRFSIWFDSSDFNEVRDTPKIGEAIANEFKHDHKDDGDEFEFFLARMGDGFMLIPCDAIPIDFKVS